MNKLQSYSQQIKQIILEQAKRANVGHIGSALSIADIIAALYGSILNIPSPEDPERDRFILSKGHAALSLYAALYLAGWISQETLNTYCTEGTLLGVHPEYELRGVDFATGSLGHGLSFGVGSALAARLQGSERRVFVLVSDAECEEGSLWEAVMSAAHFKLGNLVVIIDLNGQQALGNTDQIMSLPPMVNLWSAFGWDAIEVDGHNVDEITRVISGLDPEGLIPHVIIAHTISGKGVSFMERQVKWHYWPMSDDQYRQALNEIGAEQP